MEFETQFRIETDALGPALWQRRDAVPDEYPRGGGVATPLVAGVVSLAAEAYDGELWYQDWDSDYHGLPLAVRITVVASGHREGQDVLDAPLATLRTVMSIDRVVPPETGAQPEVPTDTELPEAAPDLAEPGEAPGVGQGGTAGSNLRGGTGGRGTQGPDEPPGGGGTQDPPSRRGGRTRNFSPRPGGRGGGR
jgi:hypothetical protein